MTSENILCMDDFTETGEPCTKPATHFYFGSYNFDAQFRDMKYGMGYAAYCDEHCYNVVWNECTKEEFIAASILID